MVFTIQRYIFRELFKVFLLTALALALMMSIGSILRPVQEHGIGPSQVVSLMIYFLPVTLTFILPIAALFAASLVYGRFAADNELDACKASGISLLTLVYPGAVLALVVSISTLLLSFYVMPTFVALSEESLKADAKQILFRNIERRGYYDLPESSYRIYADWADIETDTLAGVILVEMDSGKVNRTITTERASVDFISHQNYNQVRITATRTSQITPGQTSWFSVEQMSLTREFGSLLGDQIKFKKVDEMKKIARDPVKFYPVARDARRVKMRYIAELLARDISQKTQQGDLYRLHSGTRIIELSAADSKPDGDRRVWLDGPLTVMEYSASDRQLQRTLQSDGGWLYIDGDAISPTLTLELSGPSWQLADGSTGAATGRMAFRGLIIPQPITGVFTSESLLDDISPAAIKSQLGGELSSRLESLQRNLLGGIENAMVRITGEIHARMVFGVGCIFLILIGIGLGILKKGGHLLSAFGISALPATVLVVSILTGKSFIKNTAADAFPGEPVIWSGVVFLALLTIIIYRKLLKS